MQGIYFLNCINCIIVLVWSLGNSLYTMYFWCKSEPTFSIRFYNQLLSRTLHENYPRDSAIFPGTLEALKLVESQTTKKYLTILFKDFRGKWFICQDIAILWHISQTDKWRLLEIFARVIKFYVLGRNGDISDLWRGTLFFNVSHAVCDLCIYNYEATEFET